MIITARMFAPREGLPSEFEVALFTKRHKPLWKSLPDHRINSLSLLISFIVKHGYILTDEEGKMYTEAEMRLESEAFTKPQYFSYVQELPRKGSFNEKGNDFTELPFHQMLEDRSSKSFYGEE